MNTNPAGDTIATILRHDSTVTSDKLTLVRALTDLAIAFPDVGVADRPVAVPLRLCADQWSAYCWPFVAPDAPIAQGQRATRDSTTRQDMRFRPALTELRVPRRAAMLPTAVRAAHEAAVAAIATALRLPIRHAGQGEWGIFARPGPLHDHRMAVSPIPGASPTDTCLVGDAPLWRTCRAMALWVDALCIHEWALFTEHITARGDRAVDRGMAYRLLTAEPTARRPLTWERNQIRVLLLKGATFTCPWTGRSLAGETPYALDHVLPVAVLPINELWNLAPADPRFNTVEKHDRLLSTTRLAAALPRLTGTYLTYACSPTLGRALRENAALRFSRLPDDASAFPHEVARAAVGFIEGFATARNLARF